MGTKVRIVADGMDRMAYFGSGQRALRPYEKCVDAMWHRSMFADLVSKN